MTTYYFGPGGSDGNDGLTWANRKATIGHAESISTAGTIIYFGPGLYQEGDLDLSHSGSSGNEIQWIGDVTGEHTDGVGGPVMWEGASGFYGMGVQSSVTVTYRIFKNFVFFGQLTNQFVYVQSSLSAVLGNTTFDSCVFLSGDTSNEGNMRIEGVTGTLTIRRCAFLNQALLSCIQLGSTDYSTTGVTVIIENCFLIPYSNFDGIRLYDIADCYVRNNTFISQSGSWLGIQASPSGGNIYVYNNLILREQSGSTGLEHISGSANIYADNNWSWPYNNVTGSNITLGGHQRTSPGFMVAPLLYKGIRFPWVYGVTAPYFRGNFAGAFGDDPGPDIWGYNVQPQGKKTVGASQFRQVGRNTSDFPTGGHTTSIDFPDAGADSIRIACAPGRQVTVSCQVKRESGYTGTNPQMILRSPGETDVTVTDAGAVNSWNSINGNITPTYSYIIVEFRNNNTKRKAHYVRFSDIDISQTPL